MYGQQQPFLFEGRSRCPDALDNVWGPLVDSCRREFDFTLLFEQSVLSIPVTAICLPCVVWKLWELWRAPAIVAGRGLKLMKVVMSSIAAISQLLLLFFWCSPAAFRTEASIPSSILSLVTLAAIIPLSLQEHAKTTRPSPTISSYLFISTIMDIAQLRTLWMMDQGTSAAILFSVLQGSKVLFFCLECIHKVGKLKLAGMPSLSPEDTNGILSRGFFLWIIPLIYTGATRPLKTEDLFASPLGMDSEGLGNKLSECWNKSTKSSKNSLLIAAFSAFKYRILQPVLPRLLTTFLQLCQPLLLVRVITYISEPNGNNTKYVGLSLLVAHALVFVGNAVCNSWYIHQLNKHIAYVRGALISMVYNRTTELGISALEKSSSVTIMSADVERTLRGIGSIHDIWACTVQVGAGSYLLADQLGAAASMAVLVAIVCGFVTTKIGFIAAKAQVKWLREIEKRIEITSSMLSSMKGVKMSGLTEKLGTIVHNLRVTELSAASTYRWWVVGSITTAWVPVVISPVLTFAAFIVITRTTGTTLDTARMFASLSLLNLISQRLSVLYQLTPHIAGTITCCQRIQTFIQTDSRKDPRQLVKSPTGRTNHSEQHSSSLSNGSRKDDNLIYLLEKDEAIAIRDATFGWKPSEPVLHSISTSIPRAKLTMVIGPVGCGKSTFLQSLLGEVPSFSGTVTMEDISVAYCDQSPWIVNGTFQENVIGFEDYDKEYFSTVIQACALNEDLSRLPNERNTNLGSRGLTLSGGQKQRVALARAVYARRELNIFDDMLSGLDVSTEETVWKAVFGTNGLLRKDNRTVVLATHTVKRLQFADHVIVIGPKGSILEQGTYESLKQAKGYVQGLDICQLATEENHEQEHSSSIQWHPGNHGPETPMEQEVIPRAKSVDVYWYYFKAGGVARTLVLWGIGLLYSFGSTFPYLWAKWWSDENSKHPGHNQGIYLGIYTGLQFGCLGILVIFIWQGMNVLPTKAGINLHRVVLRTVLNAPMSFFDKTDTGEIINRFSQDMQFIDGELPMAIINTLILLFIPFFQLLLILGVSIYILLTFPFIGLVLYILQLAYLPNSRRMRTIDLELRAPIYSQFLEALEGLATIRAFSWQQNVKKLNYKRVNEHLQPYYLQYCLQAWVILVTLCMVAGLVIIILALILAFRDNINPGFAAVALTNVVNLGQIIGSFLMVLSQADMSFTSVERIRDFEKNTPSENNPEVETFNPPSLWPEKGSIDFENVSASYNEGATYSLKNINMRIKPGEKIGVCGRTGSGKTSLMLSLFRMLEVMEGRILIDGTDITTITRNRIRSTLNAISQEPFFFSGTIRHNAIPYSSREVSEDEIWSILDRVHLRAVIEAKGGLDAEMSNTTLSHGEKQLFCLARALLKKDTCRIVVLDEATSNIDVQTDRLIQKTIEEDFKDCTVITIAHRLETIMRSDKIAVLDGGELMEFDAPSKLLAQDSRFKKLLHGSRRA